jgi:hypothetical protein
MSLKDEEIVWPKLIRSPVKRIEGGYETGPAASWALLLFAGYGATSVVWDALRIVGWL